MTLAETQATPAASESAVQAPREWLLQLADTALVLAQRNAEWTGHGPVLEEDIALANVALDLLGQARLLYQCVARRDADGTSEDTLAYFRDVREFRNPVLVELPHRLALAGPAAADRDYAVTIARSFLHSAFMVLMWESLARSPDTDLAAIAAKSLKETRYHLRHARDWLVRLGDGTAESHARMQAALDHVMPYLREYWAESPAEAAAREQGVTAGVAALQSDWNAIVDDALAEATLARPADGGFVPRGKEGLHSEHLGFLLAEMQSLARQHPGAEW